MGLPTTLPMKEGLGGPWPQSVQNRFGVAMFSQFVGAQMIARKYGHSREQLDRYALRSHERAIAATQRGDFADEIVAVPVDGPDGASEPHRVDEGIRFDASYEGIASVKLLDPEGVISAASASQICDGASAVMIASEAAVKAHGLTPLARIHNLTVTAGDPVVMLEEPLFATDRALARSGLRIGDIDLYEVNEAFAPVPLAWLEHTGADPERLNVNGGAIALGHPLGASGAKLMATLVHALRRRGGRYGLQTMCEGGGIANVTIVERL
jgi:acetyl-CoA C-acetyltransferase